MLKIDQALISSFIAGSFGLDIAYENMSFDPNTQYAEIKVLQNDITGYDLSKTNQTDGVFRIILRYPNNSGAVAIKQKADEIFSHFAIGSKHTYEDVLVKIRTNKRMPGINEDGYFKLVLDLGYQAFISR